MPVTTAVELVPLKTFVHVSVRAGDAETAVRRAIEFVKAFMSHLYQQNVGVQNLRAELADPAERKDEPGVWDATLVLRADVPTTVRVLGADDYLNAWRQIVKDAFKWVTREWEEYLLRRDCYISLTRRVIPGEEAQQEAKADKPKRMIPVVAIIGGVTHTIEISAEDTILDGVLDKGIKMKFQCKAGVCEDCKIRVLEGMEHLPPVQESEITQLGERTKQGWRLSCQITCNGPIKFEQP